MKARLTTVSLALIIALLAVWGVLMSFDWVQEYFATKQNPAYQELPFEFKLKVNPEDVIFSEAYQTASGTDVVKYAYVTDEVGPQPNEDLRRRTPVSYTEVIDEFENEDGKPMETLKTTFMSKSQFYEKEGKWRQIEYATTTSEIFAMSGAIPYIKKREWVERLLPGAPVFATLSTFYPDPNTETDSVDGYVEGSGYFTDFAPETACDEAFIIANTSTLGDTAIDSGTGLELYVGNNSSLVDPDFDCTATIRRSFVLFNTATLPDNSSISAVNFKLYVTAKTNSDNDGSDTINVVSASPASNTAIVADDYEAIGSTLYATAADITSVSTGAYTTFALNGTGIAAVSPTNVSKFGVREGHDISGLRPDNHTNNSVTFSSADTSGTSQDPTLDATYTVPATFSFGMWFPF